MIEWISIEDRLPIVESELNLIDAQYKIIEVICFDGSEVYCEFFSAGKVPSFWSGFECFEHGSPKPTHWMYLPKPPVL